MAVEIPHLSFPFRIESDRAAVDEQGLQDEIEANVINCLLTRRGFRLENPAYGLREMAFGEGGVNLQEIEAAIEQWEDRLPFVLDEYPDAVDQFVRHVQILIGGTDA